ncbi:MAG: Phosphoglycerate mutase family protein, partial [uncultured Frankineae bacterium]
ARRAAGAPRPGVVRGRRLRRAVRGGSAAERGGAHRAGEARPARAGRGVGRAAPSAGHRPRRAAGRAGARGPAVGRVRPPGAAAALPVRGGVRRLVPLGAGAARRCAAVVGRGPGWRLGRLRGRRRDGAPRAGGRARQRPRRGRVHLGRRRRGGLRRPARHRCGGRGRPEPGGGQRRDHQARRRARRGVPRDVQRARAPRGRGGRAAHVPL